MAQSVARLLGKAFLPKKALGKKSSLQQKVEGANPSRGSLMKYMVTCSSGLEKEAKAEITTIVGNVKASHAFMRGILLVEAKKEFPGLIRDADTKYIAHIYPIQKELKIGKAKEEVQRVIEAVLELNNISEKEKFAVHCERRGQHDFRSRDLENAVGNVINAKVDLGNPDKIVMIQIIQDLVFISIVKSDELVTKELKIIKKYEERPLNRAEMKLREAIQEFRIGLKTNWRVLDIGAAPGGWTKVLAGKVKEVVAVDKGELDESVSSMPNVRHIRKRIEDAEELGAFDMIVNDMNLEPKISAEIMCKLSENMKPDGIGIMTIKFVTSNRSKHVKEAIEILSKCFNNIETQRLLHNRFETTAKFLKKK